MSPKTRLFLILFLAGLAGVVSFLLVDLSALVALVPHTAGSEIPTITPALKFLSLIQPTVLLAVAVLIGVALAPKVGLSSPVAESLAAGQPAVSALKPQLLPGVVGALIGALAIILTGAVIKPFLATEIVERMSELGRFIPFPTRLLSGGITEELLLRWGLMTLLVWLAWRLFQKRRIKPSSISFVVAILLSSVIFALGHLPLAFLLLPDAGVAIVVFVIVSNSAFGIVAGYLYWQYGLESAILAHMICHVLLAAASYAEVYF